jgi:calcineurin-like phosphoesterase family protein
MNYWITSDTHYGHKMLVDKGYRPKDFEYLINQNLCNVMNPEDVLIHLGDFCIGHDSDWNYKFNRMFNFVKRYICLGNHDSKSISWYLNNGWDFVCESFMLDMFGRKILFSHKPMDIEHDYSINIHGHLHNIERKNDPDVSINGFQYLINIEANGYKPYNLKTIIKEIDIEKRKHN